jgi:hypothetical protein
MQVSIGATFQLWGYTLKLPLTVQKMQLHTRIRAAAMVSGVAVAYWISHLLFVYCIHGTMGLIDSATVLHPCHGSGTHHTQSTWYCHVACDQHIPIFPCASPQFLSPLPSSPNPQRTMQIYPYIGSLGINLMEPPHFATSCVQTLGPPPQQLPPLCVSVSLSPHPPPLPSPTAPDRPLPLHRQPRHQPHRTPSL